MTREQKMVKYLGQRNLPLNSYSWFVLWAYYKWTRNAGQDIAVNNGIIFG